jgi:hypothetical protein
VFDTPFMIGWMRLGALYIMGGERVRNCILCVNLKLSYPSQTPALQVQPRSRYLAIQHLYS